MNTRADNPFKWMVCPVISDRLLYRRPERMLFSMAADLNDNALMLRYCDGDLSAFETLYARHRGALFRFLVRQLNNQQRAEDVFQDVWSKIIAGRANYRPSAKFSTYLYHIARNCIIDSYRQTSRQSELLVSEQENSPEAVATTGDPVAATNSAQLGAAIVSALAQLPEDQREAFLLKEECGLSLAEIGDITGVNRETVKSRLRYALQKLRSSMPALAENGVRDE